MNMEFRDRMVFIDYNLVPQGSNDDIDEFCCQALYDNGIFRNLEFVTKENIAALGKPERLMNSVFVFRIIILPHVKKSRLDRNHLKSNGKVRTIEWQGYDITKRTLTDNEKNVSLWEYTYRMGENDWIILHRYAPIQSNKNVNEQNININNNGEAANNNAENINKENNNQLNSENALVMHNSQTNKSGQQDYSDEHGASNDNIDNNDGDNGAYVNQEEGADSNQNDQMHEAIDEVDQCVQILTEAFQREYSESIDMGDEANTNQSTQQPETVNEVDSMQIEVLQNPHKVREYEDVDIEHLDLLDIPTSLYFQVLRQSIEKKKFFNKPITIYEELLKFKPASDTLIDEEEDDNNNNDAHGVDDDDEEDEDEEIFSFSDLTKDDFQFIVENKLIHLTSPAGTGKTMTIWQLAKSVDLEFRRKLVPIAVKAEHYYNQIKLADQFNFQHLSVEALVRGSMHTAEVKNIGDQQQWCENLEATIKNGTGIVLLIDAVDEMKSRDREEFLKHVEFLTANLPGVINGEVNLKALVVSSRPGLTLPTDSDDMFWLQLELIEHDDSEHVLQTLCDPESAVYKKALELCEHYEFPRYLFWYSLLVIEAETMDQNSTLTASQFDFLGGLLLRSIKTTKDKKMSLDIDQSAMFDEDPTYLLLLAGLIAYISKVMQITTITDLERELSHMMTDLSFRKSIIDSRGSVIKKLLPVLQFCHCCTSCTEDSTDKMIVFDHQIVFDYLVASFIIKTILQQTHHSLSQQITMNPSLSFDWQRFVKDTAHYDSEWTQVMHLIADALPVRDFITTIKQCSLSEAEAWLSRIIDHPQCYDIEDPSFAYVKLIVSCLFNASRKSVPNSSKKKQSIKMKKSKKESLHSDDKVTRLSFEVLLKLFSQRVIGPLIIEDICQIKSLSLIFTELTLRNLHERFIRIFIDQFNAPSTTEQRMPEELVTLAIRLYNMENTEVNTTIQDGLFLRLSSRCAPEPISSPIIRAIHQYFRKIQAFGYLIDKLASDEELEVASAIPILLSFKTYRTMHFIQIDALLMDIAQRQSSVPDDVGIPKHIGRQILLPLIACGSLTWLEIKQACRYFDDEHFSCLREIMRTYYKSIKSKSVQTQEEIRLGYFDSFSRKKSETFLAFGMAGKPTIKGFLHDTTQEQTQLFREFVEVASLMLKAREEYKPLATLTLINDEYVAVTFDQNTVEEAIIALGHNNQKISVQFDTNVRKNLLIHRCHIAQLGADNVLLQLHALKDQLTSSDITRLLDYASDCFSLKGTRREWYPVINYSSLEKLFVELCSEERSFEWSPETVVKVWELLGTDCYQFYLEEFYHDQVFPDLIETMTAEWSKEEACAFLAAVMQMDLRSKLQYDVMQMIALLTIEE